MKRNKTTSTLRTLSIRIAGNTQNPALQTLKDKGYRLWIEPEDPNAPETEYMDWNAEKDGRFFSATCPEALLGLVAMQEHRRDDWMKTDDEANIVSELIDIAYPDDTPH